ncbi:uncharacterized membrane protein At3g27390-like isoform X1 [Typha latifolia]|uniref:uncharacterized membrane protein At3g27390-like isoform X1 n=2 Tax=Typha latifolia TaxID=4733 RepID=UPI003C300867
MEPPKGFWAALWSFLCFLPYFFGLLLLGIVKGALVCPLVCLIMTIGNSAIILGLWPVHAIWTFYCIVRAKQLGPVLKLVLSIGVSVILASWPIVGIMGSVLASAGYGFLAPVMATFHAVGEGNTDMFVHCFVDGTWTTIKGSCTVVRDLKDMCFHSYFSTMDDLRLEDPPNGKPYEIRLWNVPAALLSFVCGIMVDMPMVSLIAIYKSPIMLFKGWKRLIQDLIGREGPFLETACVPFAGLAILLWPLAVAGAVIASIMSSLPLGAYAAVVAYQESSIRKGLFYIVSSLAMFDEYTNDVLDMPEGSCFPRYRYRKVPESPRSSSMSRPNSFRREKKDVKNPPSRAASFKDTIRELTPIKLLEGLFLECKRHGETLVAEGVITREDIEESKSGKAGSGILSIGLPAYVILHVLLQSIEANSDGLLLSDGTEITSDNRPKYAIFDWFFDPLMIIREQIKAEKFSEEEQNYLSKFVLLIGDSKRLKNLVTQMPSLSDRKRGEIDAFSRRLQGITRSISRYPTAKRRFDDLVKKLSEELEKKMEGSQSINGSQPQRSKSILKVISRKSFGRTRSRQSDDQESQPGNGSLLTQ